MAYKVKPDGSIEVDSLEEALALSKRLSAPDRTSRAAGAPQPPPPASPAPELPAAPKAPSQTRMKGWEMFAGSLPENQHRLLSALKNEGRLSLEDMQIVLGVNKNQGVTGVLSGIVKNAKRAGVAATDVLVRETFGDAVTYLPGNVLRTASGFDPPAKKGSTMDG